MNATKKKLKPVRYVHTLWPMFLCRCPANDITLVLFGHVSCLPEEKPSVCLITKIVHRSQFEWVETYVDGQRRTQRVFVSSICRWGSPSLRIEVRSDRYNRLRWPWRRSCPRHRRWNRHPCLWLISFRWRLRPWSWANGVVWCKPVDIKITLMILVPWFLFIFFRKSGLLL